VDSDLLYLISKKGNIKRNQISKKGIAYGWDSGKKIKLGTFSIVIKKKDNKEIFITIIERLIELWVAYFIYFR